MCAAPVKNPLPVGEGVWSMCKTMKTGRYFAWLSAVAVQMLTGCDLGTMRAYRHVQVLTLPES